MTARIDSALKAAVDAHQIPGCVAAVFDQTSTLYSTAFGVRALDMPTPMTVDTVFRLASMTKAITSIAAMQLVELNKLTLDQPVAEVLPEFGQLKVLTGFYGEHPALRTPARPATLRHLLTHTSGLAYQFWNAPLTRWLEVTNTAGILAGTFAGLTAPLTCDPGAAWVYGSGTDWAGRMVEAASGKTLDVYLEESILGPLGMHETRFEPTAAMRARMVGVTARDPNGTLTALPFEWPAGHEYWNGGHRLHSTAADYTRFVQMLLNRGTFNGTQILQSATADVMHQNHIGELLVTNLETVAPSFTANAEFFPGLQKKHGLAYMLNAEQAPGRRAADSGFWAGVFNTFFWFDPHHQLGAILLMQTLPFADTVTMAVLDQFEAAVYATFRA